MRTVPSSTMTHVRRHEVTFARLARVSSAAGMLVWKRSADQRDLSQLIRESLDDLKAVTAGK